MGDIISNKELKQLQPIKLNLNNFNPNNFNPSYFPEGTLKNGDLSKYNFNKQDPKKVLVGQLIDAAADRLITNKLFSDDSETGRIAGQMFGSGLTAGIDTVTDNLYRGEVLTKGLALNVGASLAGTGAGIAGNLIGKGITSVMGNSMLGRGIGAGVASGIGQVGGTALSNLIKSGTLGGVVKGKPISLFGSKGFFKLAGAINPYGLASSVVGAGLLAAFGPSKEYEGKYGGITKTMDTVYDGATFAANFIPGAGQAVSGLMTLNKGLSNIFGSTSGMTVQDAILGSAFMPAPVKWLNMAGAKTTDTFNNQNTWTINNVNRFMQNGFGDLGDKFDLAREESNKTYGTFSQGAYRRAQNNIDFSNRAFEELIAMNHLNDYQNIRSQDMTSINNQRYAQNIMGGYSPIYVGKQGMKIFNNAINHNIGMRLLSGAALIDDKLRILCNVLD